METKSQMPPGRDNIHATHPRRIAALAATCSDHDLSMESQEVRKLVADRRNTITPITDAMHRNSGREWPTEAVEACQKFEKMNKALVRLQKKHLELLRRADEALDAAGVGCAVSPLRCEIRSILAPAIEES